MKELKKDQSNGILSIHFHADANEFSRALQYLSQLQGDAFTADCRDAAILLAQSYLRDSDESFADVPEILLEEGPDEQGISFILTVPVYPDVTLGQYKGITVSHQDDPEAVQESILSAAVDAMRAELPEKLLLRKQQSIEALDLEFLAQDSYYILLADVLAILETSCRKLGVSRPPQHSLAEAVDLMIRFMSESNQQSMEIFRDLIKENLLRLCDIPPAFNEEFDRIISLRRKKVQEQTEEERAEALLEVYLRSRNLSKKAWHEETLARADYMVRLDLLLNAVAAEENLQVSEDELRVASLKQPDVPQTALSWMLLQEKAKKLILDSAVIIR